MQPEPERAAAAPGAVLLPPARSGSLGDEAVVRGAVAALAARRGAAGGAGGGHEQADWLWPGVRRMRLGDPGAPVREWIAGQRAAGRAVPGLNVSALLHHRTPLLPAFRELVEESPQAFVLIPPRLPGMERSRAAE